MQAFLEAGFILRRYSEVTVENKNYTRKMARLDESSG